MAPRELLPRPSRRRSNTLGRLGTSPAFHEANDREDDDPSAWDDPRWDDHADGDCANRCPVADVSTPTPRGDEEYSGVPREVYRTATRSPPPKMSSMSVLLSGIASISLWASDFHPSALPVPPSGPTRQRERCHLPSRNRSVGRGQSKPTQQQLLRWSENDIEAGEQRERGTGIDRRGFGVRLFQ